MEKLRSKWLAQIKRKSQEQHQSSAAPRSLLLTVLKHGFPENHPSNFVRKKIILSEEALSLVTGQFGFWACCLTLNFILYHCFFPEKIRIFKIFSMERKKSKSHIVFQSYKNHLGEKQSIKQVTNITHNAYSEKSADQPETNPGSRLNHSRAITMKRTKVTISWYLWENSNPFIYFLSQNLCRTSLNCCQGERKHCKNRMYQLFKRICS